MFEKVAAGESFKLNYASQQEMLRARGRFYNFLNRERRKNPNASYVTNPDGSGVTIHISTVAHSLYISLERYAEEDPVVQEALEGKFTVIDGD